VSERKPTQDELREICEAYLPNHCSFCGKHRTDVRFIITGPLVTICDECAFLSVDVLAGQGIEPEDGSVFHLRAALAHEKDRARRVVRVFWRVRDEYSGYTFSFIFRKHAFTHLKLNSVGKVYRVTVRQVKR